MLPENIVEKYILEIAQQDELEECWTSLVERLAVFGFNRLMYGSRENWVLGSRETGSLQRFTNLSNTLLFSTYGKTLDETFLYGRMYIDSPSVRWASLNEGAVSWSVFQQEFIENKLTAKETKVFLTTRELGLKAGYTYSIRHRVNEHRSCFGLCFQEGGTQADADAAWEQNARVIVQLLNLFETAVKRFRNVPHDQELPQSTLSVLRLLTEGRTISEIADLHGKHRRTIEDQLARARAILGASNTVQAVYIARHQGQI
ncbi:MAG: autoinducer binding domain-containing protein [Paracoccaceae bacterium]